MNLQKNKPWRCANYLRWIRTQRCCNCLHPETVPHHIIGIGYGTMGDKADDFQAMPLCVGCHELIHANTRSFNQLLYLHRTKLKAQEDGVLSLAWAG